MVKCPAAMSSGKTDVATGRLHTGWVPQQEAKLAACVDWEPGPVSVGLPARLRRDKSTEALSL